PSKCPRDKRRRGTGRDRDPLRRRQSPGAGCTPRTRGCQKVGSVRLSHPYRTGSLGVLSRYPQRKSELPKERLRSPVGRSGVRSRPPARAPPHSAPGPRGQHGCKTAIRATRVPRGLHEANRGRGTFSHGAEFVTDAPLKIAQPAYREKITSTARAKSASAG